MGAIETVDSSSLFQWNILSRKQAYYGAIRARQLAKYRRKRLNRKFNRILYENKKRSRRGRRGLDKRHSSRNQIDLNLLDELELVEDTRTMGPTIIKGDEFPLKKEDSETVIDAITLDILLDPSFVAEDIENLN